jgi:NTP pyrophosphatase (non-canonical NTP hydrolase)
MKYTIEHIKLKVLTDVNAERNRQDNLWGLQRHDFGEWLGILGEEFGEVCQAINRIHFPNDAKPTDADNLYKELIHVAAVAVAIAEHVKENQLITKGEFRYGEN